MGIVQKMSTILKQVISAYPHSEKIRIPDAAKVGVMLENLVKQGAGALQVITDFDYTLSRSILPDGRPAETAPGVLNQSPFTSKDFKTKVNLLRDKYRPIEFDHSIPVDEKIPLMVEWYQKKIDIIVESKISKQVVADSVKSCNVVLRDNAMETLSLLAKEEVPLLIFSAGNGNIIEAVMRRDGALFQNAHVISNFYKYDDQGFVIGYMNDTLLHVFNKNEHALESTSYFEDLSHRPNALVLGDHIADAAMADGMQDPEVIFKIGFLNESAPDDATLNIYAENFDVVLVDDQSFDFVNLILAQIIKR